MKLHSGSASTGFLLHNSGKSRSVSNVMFHLMYVMLGRKLILLEENRNPVSLWSEIFRCIEVLHLIPVCIWMLEFLSWGSCVTSVVRCLLLFDLQGLLIKHADFMVKNLLVITFFTWDARCTKWDQTVLKKVFLGLVSNHVLYTSSEGILMWVAMTWKGAPGRQPQTAAYHLLFYLSQGQTRVGRLSLLRWNCIMGELPDKSKPCAWGRRCLPFLMLKRYCTIYNANPLCSLPLKWYFTIWED